MEEGEGHEISHHSPLSTLPPAPPPDSDLPHEPPANLGFQEPPPPPPPPLPSSSLSSITVLRDALRDKIIKQVEFYFSDENLPSDKFLMKYVKKDKQGFVPIAVIASFRKMKKLVHDNSLLEAALRASSQLVVSSDGKKVKRMHPLSAIDIVDAKSCTVLVENLPEDYTADNIQRIFGDVGKVKNISIRNPQSVQGSTKVSKAEMAISSKLHALVEYETAEAAEKSVATLNDEKNWRSGMRVELLLKRMGKYGLAPRVRKGTVPEKSSNIPVSDAGDELKLESVDHHVEMPEEEQEEEHLRNEKGGRRGRSRGRGNSYRHHVNNTHGHGSECISKAPPGPRMPDGTRGFTMGRGRPPLSNHN
eukprot:TRINITY_DN1432_c0_g1_i4.p1 TRINITY_DN1432_c0_g1~~TRINITY_DN1432_c0_g1_i4.p1  ORF type:complete len:362 (+),score=97.30 TRINITY_DN1432_c0_g1_i4:78-1163(+)